MNGLSLQAFPPPMQELLVAGKVTSSGSRGEARHSKSISLASSRANESLVRRCTTFRSISLDIGLLNKEVTRIAEQRRSPIEHRPGAGRGRRPARPVAPETGSVLR
jgi:hypothetical protein